MRPWPNGQRFHAVCRRLTTEAARCRGVIAEKNPNVNAFVFISEQPPSSVSIRADAGRSLLGWSVAVKDNICTTTMPTTCSSQMLKGSSRHSHHFCVTNGVLIAFTSPYDATVVTLLRESGTDIIGKTNCDEFGMGYAKTFRLGLCLLS